MSGRYELDALAVVGARLAGDLPAAQRIARASDNPAELAVFVSAIAVAVLHGFARRIGEPVEAVWQDIAANTGARYP